MSGKTYLKSSSYYAVRPMKGAPHLHSLRTNKLPPTFQRIQCINRLHLGEIYNNKDTQPPVQQKFCAGFPSESLVYNHKKMRENKKISFGLSFVI